MTSSPRDNDEFLAVLGEELRSTPYRPVVAIGAGGMGALYEVEHRTLKRRLAMKILRDPGRADLEDRLRLEAQSLAQLSHPNLVQVVDYARSGSGRPFLVCERLYGKTLKDLLGPVGALEVELAVRYTIEALGGLHTAHRAGVVHRDVKLDNLFLCEGDDLRPGHVKVIDFGIAKLVGAKVEGRAVDVAPLANPTEEGAMIGTPSFMSPEQITNQRVDHRADIYGVGVVLYRMLAGRNPFLCRDTMEYAMAHATEIPSPPSRFATLPSGLDAIVMRALEKDPEHRFASAKQMIEALTPYATQATWPALAPAPTPALAPAPTPAPTPAPAPAPPPTPAPPPETASRGTVRMLESPLAVSPPQGLPRSTELLMEPPTLRDPRRYAPPPQALPPRALDATVVPQPRAGAAWLSVGLPLTIALLALAAIVWFGLRLAGKV